MATESEIILNEDSVKQESEENGSQSNLSKLEIDIIRQIEYYFGESNLRRDKFLTAEIEKDKDGWVPISVLLTFNRLKAISEDANIIAESLEKSTHGLVQVSEDKQKIRRHPDNPLPEFNEERRKDVMSRTAYAKGFPLDSKMSTLVEYFNDNFEHVENVIMRKYFCQKTKVYLFKGSVFVLFEKREHAENFVNKEGLIYGEKELLRYMQEKYFEVKKKEKHEKYEKIKIKKKEAAAAAAAIAAAEAEEITLPRCSVVHFTQVEGDISREDIRKRCAEIDPALTIAFIHFERGNKDGQIRFSKEGDAKIFIEKLEDSKMKLKELILPVTLVEGDAETEFLKNALEDMKRARSKSSQKQKGGGGRFKGGRNNNRNDRKRRNEDNSKEEEAPASKQAKEDKSNGNEVTVVTAAE